MQTVLNDAAVIDDDDDSEHIPAHMCRTPSLFLNIVMKFICNQISLVL